MTDIALVAKKTMNVLLIGNNPSELSLIYDQLKESDTVNYISDFAFDISDIEQRIKKFHPDCIVIDDNLERATLSKLLHDLSTNELSSGIPITIIQNSNSDDTPRDGADEFLLKNLLSSERITKGIMNSFKIHELRKYMKESYAKRKKHLLALK